LWGKVVGYLLRENIGADLEEWGKEGVRRLARFSFL